jgi:hypothetical protein
MTVSWKKNVWTREYRIFRDKLIVGLLKGSTLNRQAYGEFNGAMLRFRNKGFGNSQTSIYDIEGTREVGQIHYNIWKSSARISFEGKTYEWKYESWRRNKWRISDSHDCAQFNVTGIWQKEGTIDIGNLPQAVVLIGLFIGNHFKTMQNA